MTKASTTGKVLLSLISTLLSFVFAEYALAPVLLSMTDQPSRYLTLLGVAARPNVLVDDTMINSQGFTGDVLGEQKPPHTKRILTLGGSVMFNRRMTERLIGSLKMITSTPLEVQGGALRSHTSRDSVIKYKYHFHRYHFDYVLIYEGVNDLWMNHISADKFKSDYSHARPWYRRNIVLNNSLLARYIYNNFLWSRPKCYFEDWPVLACHNGANFRAYETFAKNTRDLVKLIRNDKGVPILMTFAWYIPANYTRQAFLDDKLGYVNPTHYDKCPVELWGAVTYVREGIQELNRIIRNIARDENVLIIDQDEMLSDNILMFGDPVHPSEKGADIFVRNITDFFLMNRLLNG
jgi:lysophospholipase L1-like esterase